MMDATSNTTDLHFKKYIDKTVLYDALVHHNPTIVNQETCIGKKRLDCILVT